MAEADIRTITLTDIPLLRRLSAAGILLDTETALTRKAPGSHSTLLSSILFPAGIHTLIARGGSRQVVGQLRYRQEDSCAHIVYIVPEGDDEQNNSLLILDALAREAGRHGAHFLMAEIEPEHALYETLRQARFASYARQTIWRHQPVTRQHETPLRLAQATPQDEIGITSLLYNIIPTMLQHVALPEGDMKGLLYRHEGQIAAYIAYVEGERGIYALPFIHTDVADIAQELLEAAWTQLASDDVPLYICIRTYQYWLDSILDRMNFTSWTEQVMMVRHIAAGVHQPAFSTGKLRLQGKLEVAPPTWSIMRRN
ncbi:MAG: hypothetical protein ACPG7F_15375, partial [Aggregatilineales bacterium]